MTFKVPAPRKAKKKRVKLKMGIEGPKCMYTLGYHSFENRISLSSIAYPTLEIAQKALEAKQYEYPALSWQIFSVTPVQPHTKSKGESHA